MIAGFAASELHRRCGTNAEVVPKQSRQSHGVTRSRCTAQACNNVGTAGTSTTQSIWVYPAPQLSRRRLRPALQEREAIAAGAGYKAVRSWNPNLENRDANAHALWATAKPAAAMNGGGHVDR